MASPNDTSASGTGAASRNPKAPAEFSLARVLLMVLVIGAVAGGAYGIWSALQKPPMLVPFTGRVIYKGQPVTVGGVATARVDDQLDGAVGALDEEGRFELLTDGKPGAYVGRHKVMISSNTPTMPPRALIPSIYNSMSQTPLVIEVSEDPAANHQEFILEGDLPGGSDPPADEGKAAPASEPEPGKESDAAATNPGEPAGEAPQEPTPDAEKPAETPPL